MAKREEKEIERWVTVNGARVPIFKDGSVGGPKALRDKIKAVVKEKSSDGKPLKDMSATDIGKEYLTATGERKKQLLKELHNRGYKRAKDGSWTNKGESKKDANKEAKSKAFKEATANRKAHKEGKKPLPSSFDDMTSQEREEWRKKTEKAFKADKESSNSTKQGMKNKTVEENTHENRQKLKKQIADYTAAHRNPTAEDRRIVKQMRDKYDAMVKESMDKSKAKAKAAIEANRKKEAQEKQLNDLKQEHFKLSKHDEDDIPGRDAKLNSLEKQIKEKENQLSKNETVEQAMDRLQKESRAKVDSMSAQQVMKYAKENGLRGLKTDTLAQRDDRVANHMYMQEMKKWREQKNVAENETLKEKQIAQNKVQRDERNNQVSDRVKAYQDKFLKKRSVEEIKEIQSNIEKAGTHLGYTDSDMVAMRAIENELKERQNYKKEYKNPDAYFSAVSVAERALEQKALSKLEPLPYFSKEARQRDKDIANGKYRTRITDVSRLSLSDLRTVAQSLGKKTEGKSKAELVAMIEKIFKKG